MRLIIVMMTRHRAGVVESGAENSDDVVHVIVQVEVTPEFSTKSLA